MPDSLFSNDNNNNNQNNSSSNTPGKKQTAHQKWDKASTNLPFYPEPTHHSRLATRRNINFLSSPLRIIPRHSLTLPGQNRVILSPQTAAPSIIRNEVSKEFLTEEYQTMVKLTVVSLC